MQTVSGVLHDKKSWNKNLPLFDSLFLSPCRQKVNTGEFQHSNQIVIDHRVSPVISITTALLQPSILFNLPTRTLQQRWANFHYPRHETSHAASQL
jgi:hypothetical protein